MYTSWNNDGEYSKYATPEYEPGMEIKFTLKRPMPIRGFGYVLGDDVPERDPKNWTIKLLECNSHTGEESEDKVLTFEDCEGGDDVDRKTKINKAFE